MAPIRVHTNRLAIASMANKALITLDLDNTLWDVDSVIIKAEKTMVAWLKSNAPDCLTHYHSDQLGPIRQQVAKHSPNKVHDLSFMRTEVLFRVMQLTGYNTQDARSLAKNAFDVFFEGRNQVIFYPGALDMLAELAQHYTVYALTNGNADINKAGLGEYLAGAFSSAGIGQSKPHRDMFLTPLRQLNFAPQQAVHVGDNLIDDVQGANQVGMHSIWVNLKDYQLVSDDPRPGAEVTRLVDVPEAIKALLASGENLS